MNAPVAPHVVYWNTAAYKARAEGFRLSPKEAYSHLVNVLREDTLDLIVEGEGERDVGNHHVIVGDWYVFGFPGRSKRAVIPLSGYYVNGNDGSITLRSLAGDISANQQRAMWGEVLITGWGKDFSIRGNRSRVGQ